MRICDRFSKTIGNSAILLQGFCQETKRLNRTVPSLGPDPDADAAIGCLQRISNHGGFPKLGIPL